MDAFFASVEQKDNPELKGKPVAVGGSGTRGVVAAASYEARKYGVRSAMPGKIAKQKCPHLIFVKPRFSRYKEISNIIREIFYEYTDLVEPLSLDEAFLDVTENKFGMNVATDIAMEIKEKIKDKTLLTASAGISINKFVAKVASGMNKPDGLTLIHPSKVDAFIKQLPIESFFGVGKATAARMHKHNIFNGTDLQQFTKMELVEKFGKMGRYFYDVAQGIDDRPVRADRIRKSVSVENTYDKDLVTIDEIKAALKMLNDKLVSSLERLDIKGKTVKLKIRFIDFSTFSRQKTFLSYTRDAKLIQDSGEELIDALEINQPVRLLGIGLAQLDSEVENGQLDFPF
jgi:DNA polymerase-4